MEYTDIFNTVIVGILGMYIELIINVIIWILIIRAIIKIIKRKTNHKYFKNNVVINNNKDSYNKNSYKKNYIDISKEELATFNTEDLTAFKNHFYQIFLDFETAYNNLDYSIMKSLSTKQLFQNYYTGISLDLEIGKKKIINNIQKKKVIIYEVFSSTVKQVVSAMIEISYISYTINKEGYIVSGSRDNKITEKFEVIFRKDFDTKEITNCPNCGAAITNNKCDFCHTTIKNATFKISSIKKIIEK